MSAGTEPSTTGDPTETGTDTTTGPLDTSATDGSSSSTGDSPPELPPDMLRFEGAGFGVDINALATGDLGFLAAGNVQVANPTNCDPVLIDFSAEEATIWRLGTVGSNEQGWAIAAKPSGAAVVGLARDTNDLFPLRLVQNANGELALLVQADEDNAFTSLVLQIDDEDLSVLRVTRLSLPGADLRMSDLQSTANGWIVAGEAANEGAVVELDAMLEVVSGSTYTLPRLGAIRLRGATRWVAGGGTGSAMAGVLTPEGATVIETPIDAPPVFLPAAAVAGLDTMAMAGDIDGDPVLVFFNEVPTAACSTEPWGLGVGSGAVNLAPQAETVDVATSAFGIQTINLPVPNTADVVATIDECL